jgi:cyclohexanone monooxygenase
LPSGDIPSHVYQFAFAPYADWPEFYSSSKDINRYMHVVAQKFGVEPLIKVNHTIVSAIYDEDRAKWVLQVQEKGQDVKTVEVDIYVPATGVLSQVNRPNIPGMQDFDQSKILHTAEWPKDLDFKTAFKDENV